MDFHASRSERYGRRRNARDDVRPACRSNDLCTGGTVAIALVETGGNIEHDILDVSGTATLLGTLDITLVNGPILVVGQTLDVVAYGDHIGEFSQINGLDIGNGLVPQPEVRS